MTTYPIVSDEHYGWFTGIARDGTQVLVDHDRNLFFDPEGALLRIEVVGTSEDWSDERERDFHERANRLIARRARISVQAFETSDPEVSLRPMPKSYKDFLRAPESHSAEERAEYSEAIADWRRSRNFELTLGDDFWMNPDGTVNSS